MEELSSPNLNPISLLAPSLGDQVYPTVQKMRDFMVHLKQKETVCSSGPKIIVDTDIFQVYLKFTLLKATKTSSPQCDETNRFFSCLTDRQTRKFARELKHSSDAPKRLQEIYGIDKKDAKKMLHFFSTLDSKIK